MKFFILCLCLEYINDYININDTNTNTSVFINS